MRICLRESARGAPSDSVHRTLRCSNSRKNLDRESSAVEPTAPSSPFRLVLSIPRKGKGDASDRKSVRAAVARVLRSGGWSSAVQLSILRYSTQSTAVLCVLYFLRTQLLLALARGLATVIRGKNYGPLSTFGFHSIFFEPARRSSAAILQCRMLGSVDLVVPSRSSLDGHRQMERNPCRSTLR